jgi:hypothetical protein
MEMEHLAVDRSSNLERKSKRRFGGNQWSEHHKRQQRCNVAYSQ